MPRGATGPWRGSHSAWRSSPRDTSCCWFRCCPSPPYSAGAACSTARSPYPSRSSSAAVSRISPATVPDTAAARFGLAGRLAAIPRVNWLRVLDTGAATHIWPGGWSFLNVRAWMYRVFELAALAALAGLLRLVRRRIEPRFVLTASAFLLFCLGLAYFATIVFLTRGYSMVPGWYLYGIGGIEAAVLACGFTGLAGRRSARCLAALAVLAAAFDLYTVHFVSIPYYCGIVAHGASGRLAAFHVSSLRGLGLAGLLDRMAVNKPLGAGWLAVLWAGYVLSTLALAVAGLRLVMGGARPVGTRRRATSP